MNSKLQSLEFRYQSNPTLTLSTFINPALAPAPVVTHKAVHSAPVVSAYAPAPKVAYKPYVDEYADEPAVYTYEYAVKDDYSNNDFGAAESRDNYLTTGRYVVALPGKHI